MAWRLAREHWGHGYATEAATGMVFDHEAGIEDMGMVFQAVVYAITAEQWRSRTSEGLY